MNQQQQPRALGRPVSFPGAYLAPVSPRGDIRRPLSLCERPPSPNPPPTIPLPPLPSQPSSTMASREPPRPWQRMPPTPQNQLFAGSAPPLALPHRRAAPRLSLWEKIKKKFWSFIDRGLGYRGYEVTGQSRVLWARCKRKFWRFVARGMGYRGNDAMDIEMLGR